MTELKTISRTWNNWLIIAIKVNHLITSICDSRQFLDEISQSRLLHVAIDLSSVSYIDSSSIIMLINLHRNLKALKGDLVLFGIGPEIREVFDVVPLDECVTIFTTRAQFESYATGSIFS